MATSDTSDTLYDEAIAFEQQGDWEAAIGKLQELLNEDPAFALAHSALSVFYSRQEKYDEAIKHAQKVCELEPEDPFSFTALSLICQKAGRIPEAERALMQARQAQAAAWMKARRESQ
jgi:Flp pilus assembly protein TadD